MTWEKYIHPSCNAKLQNKAWKKFGLSGRARVVKLDNARVMGERIAEGETVFFFKILNLKNKEIRLMGITLSDKAVDAMISLKCILKKEKEDRNDTETMPA